MADTIILSGSELSPLDQLNSNMIALYNKKNTGGNVVAQLYELDASAPTVSIDISDSDALNINMKLDLSSESTSENNLVMTINDTIPCYFGEKSTNNNEFFGDINLTNMDSSTVIEYNLSNNTVGINKNENFSPITNIKFSNLDNSNFSAGSSVYIEQISKNITTKADIANALVVEII